MGSRMTDDQRSEVCRILEQVASEGEEQLRDGLDAALDAIAETVLPDRISRYYEAHITFSPDLVDPANERGEYTEFAESMSELGWRASKFEHDDVDGIAGKWFVSCRSASHQHIENEVRGMVSGLSVCGTVERYKIEETLLDSKLGDVL